MPNDVLRPRLRPLELTWLAGDDGRSLFIRDPSGVAPHSATVPPWVAFLLSLCDGERDAAGIGAAFELRTGQRLPAERVETVINQLDEALFLNSPRFRAAHAEALRDYRESSSRPPMLAGRTYPAGADDLIAALGQYDDGGVDVAIDPPPRGLVSPHIDYQRGGDTYAKTWRRAVEAVRSADIIVILGTDHSGGPGQITLTRQSYGTPLGILRTATAIVDALAEAIGSDEAYAEELHHRSEHSIELAAVWLHSIAGTTPPPQVVPILCGSFHEFIAGTADPATFDRFTHVLSALRRATEGRRVLMVAAADLAHVGPAFGDAEPLDADDRARLARADERLLASVCLGDADGFFGQLRAERDQRRICGLAPIYLMLRFLGRSNGQIVDYDQCAADENGGSLVSIAGVLLP